MQTNLINFIQNLLPFSVSFGKYLNICIVIVIIIQTSPVIKCLSFFALFIVVFAFLYLWHTYTFFLLHLIFFFIFNILLHLLFQVSVFVCILLCCFFVFLHCIIMKGQSALFLHYKNNNNKNNNKNINKQQQ